MANERNPNQDESTMDESVGGTRGGRQEESSPERLGGKSEENLRGTGDDSDDEFEDTDDLDDEEEDEADGTV